MINDLSSPVNYDNPAFTINTDDENLINEVVPYKLVVKFTDYQGNDASLYESTADITYKSPCPYAGDADKSYTTFTAITGTIAQDAYTGASPEIDIDSLYTVEAAFCVSTITYACTAVSGPDVNGVATTYTGTDYPFTLCSLDSATNKLIVSANEDNYKTTNDATVNMPPGTYTFTITGTTPSETGVTPVTVTTTVTWVLVDPCAS